LAIYKPPLYPSQVVSGDVASVLANMFATLLSVSLLALSQTTKASPAFEKKCLAFRPEKYIIGATRNVLEYVAADTTLSFPDNDATCNRASQAVSADLCRIALSIKTSNTSEIAFEAWFPENWSGRFLATGNGGIDGCKLKVPVLESLLSISSNAAIQFRHQVRRPCVWIW